MAKKKGKKNGNSKKIVKDDPQPLVDIQDDLPPALVDNDPTPETPFGPAENLLLKTASRLTDQQKKALKQKIQEKKNQRFEKGGAKAANLIEQIQKDPSLIPSLLKNSGLSDGKISKILKEHMGSSSNELKVEETNSTTEKERFIKNIGSHSFEQEKSRDVITYHQECNTYELFCDSDGRNTQLCRFCQEFVTKSWRGVKSNVGVKRFERKHSCTFSENLNQNNRIYYCNDCDHYCEYDRCRICKNKTSRSYVGQ
jgi:hypothetical protein